MLDYFIINKLNLDNGYSDINALKIEYKKYFNNYTIIFFNYIQLIIFSFLQHI